MLQMFLGFICDVLILVEPPNPGKVKTYSRFSPANMDLGISYLFILLCFSYFWTERSSELELTHLHTRSDEMKENLFLVHLSLK